MPPRRRSPARSEIAGDTSYFPIAVAHWLGTAAAIDFLASRGSIQCAGPAPLFGLGERPPRRMAEFAAARVGNREATCFAFRPLQLHSRSARRETWRTPAGSHFPCGSSPISWAKSNDSC